MDNYILKIKEIRKSQGITATKLANKIGVCQSYLSDMENQKYNIKLSRIIDISRALNVCPYKLSNICINCPKRKKRTLYKPLFFRRYNGITVCSKPHDLYNYTWGDILNEKTTVYIEPDLKEKVQVRLLRDREKKSLSALINEVLAKWLKEQK